MIMQMFRVYDSKAKAYLPIFFSHTLESGIRAFVNVANDPTHGFHQNPHDYNLFHLGEDDDSSGQITLLDVKENLGLAAELGNEIPTKLKEVAS